MTDRNTPSRVFVGAGTWVDARRGGLFRRLSDDGPWQAVTKGLPDPVSVQALTVHPTDRDVIHAGTDHGPFRNTDGGDVVATTDGGRTWRESQLPDGVDDVYAIPCA